MYPSSIFVKAALVALASVLIPIVYRLRIHRLSHIPGPILAKVSGLFLHVICYLGIEGRVLRHYHQKYGRVIRVGPNSVSIADPDAIRDIYVSKGGFPKDRRYRNFDLGPVVSIFSSIDTFYRDVRAKAVAPLFSPAQLRAESSPDGAIGSCIDEFLAQLREFRDARVKTDLLDLCARLSIDVVTAYLLGQRYGGLHENREKRVKSLEAGQSPTDKLSANPFIHAIVAFSRFSLLPNRLFKSVYAISQRWSSSEEVTQSFIKLDMFIDDVMKRENGQNGSKPKYYQERLVETGVVSPHEAAAQSKAIVFAGADSTAVMLATTLFHLVRNNTSRERLQNEISASASTRFTSTFDSMPFLRACVKEGLRLGMANPTRLTRVVPEGPGLQIGKGQEEAVVPPGAVVGCAAYNLHHDPDVFPEPFQFRPERWLDEDVGGLKRPDMEKSMMPFGHGLRACIGKNLAMHQLHETVLAVVKSGVLEGATTCMDKIDMYEWFNGDIKGHQIEIEWTKA